MKQQRGNDDRRQFQDLFIVGEDAVELPREEQLRQSEEQEEPAADRPCVIDSAPDAADVSRADILAHDRRDRHHDPLRDFIGEFIQPQSDPVGGRGRRPQRIDQRSHEQHGNIDRGKADGKGDAEFDQRLQHDRIDFERCRPEIEIEPFLIAVKIRQRQQERRRLAQDRCESRTGHAPAEAAHEHQVQHHIHQRRHHDEFEWPHRIADAAQDRRDHVVSVNENQSAPADQQIMPGPLKCVFRCFQQMQKRFGEKDRQRGKKDPRRQDDGELCADRLPQPLPFPPTDQLGDQHLSARGESHPDHGQEKDRLAGGHHAGNAVTADEFAHDQHVRHRVQHLQPVRKHERQGKQEHPPEQRPRGEVMNYVFRHFPQFFNWTNIPCLSRKSSFVFRSAAKSSRVLPAKGRKIL